MRWLRGQAARTVGRLLHRLATVALTLVVVVAILAVGLAWRLSMGPIDVGWVAARAEALVNESDGPTRMAIGGAQLGWDGFRHGVGNPLELRLSHVVVSDRADHRLLDIPSAHLTVSFIALLQGRLVPRSLEMIGPKLRIIRGMNGAFSLDLGSLNEMTDAPPTARAPVGAPPVGDPSADATEGPTLKALLAEFARPASGDANDRRGLFSQMRRLVIDGADLTIVDRQVAATWHAPDANIALTRNPNGGVAGVGTMTLALGNEVATLSANAVLEAGGEHTRVDATLTPIAPASLARIVPKLAFLSRVDAPIGLRAELHLGMGLAPTQARITARIGAGKLTLGDGAAQLLDANVVVAASDRHATIETAEFRIQPRPAGPTTLLKVSGTAARNDGRIEAALSVALDQLAFTDLSILWPPDLAPNARPWLLENVTTGMARNGQIDIGLQVDEASGNTVVSRMTGALDGDDLTVHWLRPVPPLDRGQARLRVLDADTLEITVGAARQKAGAKVNGYLTVRSGKVRITGLAQRDQMATIQGDANGSLANAIGLLREPRLRILDKNPVDLREPAGEVNATISVVVPLESNVRDDEVLTRATVRLTQVRLAGLVADRDIDQGNFEMGVTDDGLTVKGKTLLAGIPVQVDGTMDFRPGPPTQVVRRMVVTGRPTPRQLLAAGLDPANVLSGEIPGTATLTERRNGESEIAVEADLTPVVLAVTPIGWTKPAGVPAKGTGRVLVSKGRLKGIDRIQVEGTGLSLRATVDTVDGKMSLVHLERGVLGRTDAQGRVRLPPAGPIAIEVTGGTLDLAAKLSAKTASIDRNAPDPPPDPAWTINARFDRVLLAGGKAASSVVARANNDGRIYRSAGITGLTGPNLPFTFDIGMSGGIRHVAATAVDAGTLLQGLDAIKTLEAGRLTLSGRFDDTKRGNPLVGSANIEDFRVRGSVGLGKLLQAMTLYGLLDVLRGPGIGFSKLVAPFSLLDQTLQLNDARAFSSSLGLTAKGRLDLGGEKMDMEGTIVPAYFFNSLLGNIPLVGKLFSPETGGGVFAARYTLRGPIQDPDVFVNPLSALTPGFLREIFGLF